MSDVLIVAENLVKSYGDVKALRGVSFKVERGEIFGYLGPNAAGKTTTIKILLGFIRPNGGKAEIMGINTMNEGRFSRLRKYIGFVPEDFSFYKGMRGRDIINIVSKLRGEPPAKLNELLEMFPFDLERRVETYSKGMKQMLALIIAFMHDPELVILDEPTTGLDPIMRDKFLEFLEFEAKQGATVFFSSHVLSEVQRIADRVALIKDGKITVIEAVDTLTKKLGKKIKAVLAEKPDSSLFEIPGVSNVVIENNTVSIIVSGNITRVLEHLLRYGIVDLEVRDMTLEEVFMQSMRGE